MSPTEIDEYDAAIKRLWSLQDRYYAKHDLAVKEVGWTRWLKVSRALWISIPTTKEHAALELYRVHYLTMLLKRHVARERSKSRVRSSTVLPWVVGLILLICLVAIWTMTWSFD